MKKIVRVSKIQLQGGGAKPGAELSSLGINMPKFCNAFNDQTKDKKTELFNVQVTAYVDKSFDFIVKTSPVSSLLIKYCNIKKGSSTPGTDFVGEIKRSDVKKIAEYKMVDLNAHTIESAEKIIMGSIKSMGIKVIEG